MLAQLYHDLHEVVYRGSSSLSAGAIILQLWIWEHLPITRPISDRRRLRGYPYAFLYTGMVIQHHLGHFDY